MLKKGLIGIGLLCLIGLSYLYMKSRPDSVYDSKKDPNETETIVRGFIMADLIHFSNLVEMKKILSPDAPICVDSLKKHADSSEDYRVKKLVKENEFWESEMFRIFPDSICDTPDPKWMFCELPCSCASRASCCCDPVEPTFNLKIPVFNPQKIIWNEGTVTFLDAKRQEVNSDIYSFKTLLVFKTELPQNVRYLKFHPHWWHFWRSFEVDIVKLNDARKEFKDDCSNSINAYKDYHRLRSSRK